MSGECEKVNKSISPNGIFFFVVDEERFRKSIIHTIKGMC